MTTDEGASLNEQLIEAVRRNNLELLEEVFERLSNQYQNDPESSKNKTAELINNAKDPIGNHILHVAALNGSYEALDHILDQEGVEVDPINRIEGDTPLHSVVRYSRDEPEHGTYMVEMLIEAGCDPRIRNKNKQRPIDLASSDNEELIETLRGAEYALMMGSNLPNESAVENNEEALDEEGSASDSE